MEKFDVAIVGSGPAGSFSAYELNKLDPNLKILLIEKGQDITNRNCPVLAHKLAKCPANKDNTGCMPACSMACGFGGAGAYSDGKFNITSEFGGWLSEYIDDDLLLSLINYVDEINLSFGATPNLVDCGSEFSKMIEKKAIAVGLKLLRAKVRHLGTDENLKILKAISDYLATRVEMRFKTKVDDILVKDNKVYGVKVGEDEILADKVILCVGRDGATWLDEVFRKHNIPTINNKVDVGVRVETNNIIMEDINENLYEGKFIYNTSVGTQVRTFCSNPKGQVVVENEAGTIIANGHSYKDDKLSSENTNFALLVSHTFSEPFNEPNKYAHSVSKLANQLSCGSVIVQRYGDIKLGRRTTDQRIQEGFVKPTLKEAVPGDLGLILPYNTMKSIIEMIEALDHITPGIANEHTLLYGVEAKFYSSRPVVDNKLEVKNIKNLYVGGDGAGITRGLAQASASGVYIARNIVKGGK